MSEFSIRYFLTSDDPLSEEAFKFLIKYREEDDLLDFKEAFDPDSEKEWLEVTKDVMAFANTKGGYIVFGVRDATFELVGVDENTAKVLTSTNNFLQKINRFLDPHINLLRSKELVCDGKRVVAIWIPESIGKTHLVLKDAEFEFPSGRKKISSTEAHFILGEVEETNLLTPAWLRT
jgi:predicted HTH transcriptional regulator